MRKPATRRSTSPCSTCWWSEGGRCFNDKLGLGPAPRDKPIFSGQNGFQQTAHHIMQCETVGGQRVDSPFAEKLRLLEIARRQKEAKAPAP